MDLFQILIVLLVANVVVDVVCRRKAVESWVKPLLLGTIVLDALFLIPVLKTLVDVDQHRVDGLAGIVLLPGMLLAGALLWFSYRYWLLFRRSGSQKRRQQPPDGCQ